LFARGSVVDRVGTSLLTLPDQTFNHPNTIYNPSESEMPKWRRCFARKAESNAEKNTRKAMQAFSQFAKPIHDNYYQAEHSILKHNFYRTQTGKLVFGDPDFRPGDKICLLYGGDNDAFVLRDHGDHHRLVGCAYVEGMQERQFYQCLYDEKDIVEFEIR
jgi:hypothetical protein